MLWCAILTGKLLLALRLIQNQIFSEFWVRTTELRLELVYWDRRAQLHANFFLVLLFNIFHWIILSYLLLLLILIVLFYTFFLAANSCFFRHIISIHYLRLKILFLGHQCLGPNGTIYKRMVTQLSDRIFNLIEHFTVIVFFHHNVLLLVRNQVLLGHIIWV